MAFVQAMIRREKKDVGTQLPTKSRSRLLLDLPEPKRLWSALSKTRMRADENIPHHQPGFMKAYARTGECKAPAVLDHLERLLSRDAQRKCLVFAHHKTARHRIPMPSAHHAPGCIRMPSVAVSSRPGLYRAIPS